MRDKIFSDLRSALAAERTAILAGDYGRLPELRQRKKGLFDKLSKEEPDLEVLTSISKETYRNQRLLRAAVMGIKDADARMEAMRATLAGFQCYGREGQRESVTSARPRVERKV